MARRCDKDCVDAFFFALQLALLLPIIIPILVVLIMRFFPLGFFFWIGVFCECFILRDAAAEGKLTGYHVKLSAAVVSTVAINYWSNNLGIFWFILMYLYSWGVWMKELDKR